MNVLKSLVEWEKTHRESEKYGSSTAESIDDVSTEDGPGQFEKVKAHKSTVELAISEVSFT